MARKGLGKCLHWSCLHISIAVTNQIENDIMEMVSHGGSVLQYIRSRYVKSLCYAALPQVFGSYDKIGIVSHQASVLLPNGYRKSLCYIYCITVCVWVIFTYAK